MEAGEVLLNEGRIDEHFHPMYFVPIALLAAFTYLFNEPGMAYIILQVVVSACAVYALYKITESISTQKAAFLSAMIFVLWADNLRWNVLVMTDSLFGSLVLFFLHSVMGIRNRGGFWLLILLLIAAVFTRPVGILLVFAAGATLFHYYIGAIEHEKRAVFVIVLVIAAGVILLSTWLSGIWDFTDQYYRGNVVTYADTYSGDKSAIQFDPDYVDTSGQSPVVRTIRFLWNRPLHVLMISFFKLFYLLSGTRPYYSALHNIITVIWMSFVYTGTVIGVRAMPVSFFKTSLIALLVGNCLLVVATTVDWDNRFYLPMEAAVVIFSGLGWSRVLAGPVER
ncbi:MAG: hypothetical protein QM762_08180 [Chryseolinea sp.]